MERNRFAADGVGMRGARALLPAAILLFLAAARPPDAPPPGDRPGEATQAPATAGGSPSASAPAGSATPLPEAIPDPTPPVAVPGVPSRAAVAETPSLTIRPGTAPPPAVGPSCPIDLPRALQLGRANNQTIALARNRIASAEVALKQAQLRWLPDLELGATQLLHDGLIQRAPGEIIATHRQSIFAGGGPNLQLELNQGFFGPRIARSLIAASRAAGAATANQTLLEVAERYIDLLAAYSAAEIAREAAGNAGELARLTQEYQATGAGLPSDTARARAEFETRRQQFELSAERIAVASVALAQALYQNPIVLLVPAETSVFPIELIPADCPAEDLMARALTARPELAENRALVDAAVSQLRQTKLRPLLPNVQLGFTSGLFGGGATGFPGGMDGRYGGRDDLTASALWEVRGFGLGEVAARRQGRIQVDAAEIQQARTANRVMAEVAAAYKAIESRRRQIGTTERAVAEATRSFQLNLRRIEGGAGLPIEVLQSIQALERSRTEYLNAVSSFNRGEFRLLTAVGTTPVAPTGSAPPPPPPRP